MKDLGLSAKQDDQDLADLMALLDGHPLAMRALLPGLAEHSAKRLTDIIEGHLADFPAEDPAHRSSSPPCGLSKKRYRKYCGPFWYR